MFKHKITFLVVPLLSALTLQASDPTLNNDPFGDDIFKEMYEMQKQMDKVFERMHERIQQRSQQLAQPNTQFFLPSVGNDMGTMFVDKGTYYEYNTTVEANKDNEINLSVQNGMMTFKAKVTKTVNEQNTHQSYTSMMQRSQMLPADADASTVKMEEQGGMIVVTVQKAKTTPAIVQPLQQEQKSAPVPVENPTMMPAKTPASDDNKSKQKVPDTSTQG